MSEEIQKEIIRYEKLIDLGVKGGEDPRSLEWKRGYISGLRHAIMKIIDQEAASTPKLKGDSTR